MASSHSVLLVMDFQNFAVNLIPSKDALLANTLKVLSEARARSIPVIHITFEVRQDFPNKNKTVETFKNHFKDQLNDPSFWAITDTLKPLHTGISSGIHCLTNSELVIPRMRASAFTGVPLELALKGLNADTLILCGIATSGVVLSTAKEASDKDFSVKILRDCCADLDDSVHSALLDKALPWCSDVITSSDFLSTL